MNEQITAKELRELQEACQPDDSVHVNPYEGMTPQEAVRIEEVLEKKVGAMDADEQAEYEIVQQIADRGGELPNDAKSGNDPF